MTCDEKFINVGGKFCLSERRNTYERQLVLIMQEMYEGIRWNRNFSYYGAKDPLKINGEEILQLLPEYPEGDRDLANAYSALVQVLSGTSIDY